MGKKPETVGRRVATEEEIAKVLGGFEEEMLADLYRRREEELRSRPKAKVLEFPPKLSEQELIRRQLIIDQTWERVVEQRRELERMRTCHRGPEDSDWNL
jgi:hypothetical protein